MSIKARRNPSTQGRPAPVPVRPQLLFLPVALMLLFVTPTSAEIRRLDPNNPKDNPELLWSAYTAAMNSGASVVLVPEVNRRAAVRCYLGTTVTEQVILEISQQEYTTTQTPLTHNGIQFDAVVTQNIAKRFQPFRHCTTDRTAMKSQLEAAGIRIERLSHDILYFHDSGSSGPQVSILNETFDPKRFRCDPKIGITYRQALAILNLHGISSSGLETHLPSDGWLPIMDLPDTAIQISLKELCAALVDHHNKHHTPHLTWGITGDLSVGMRASFEKFYLRSLESYNNGP